MPITKTITLYQFDELPTEKAKEKAREWLRRCNEGENYWSEFTIDDAVEIAGYMGIEIATHDVKLMGGGTRAKPSIYFSGFWSQGDGACFEGKWNAANVSVDKLKEHAPQDKALHYFASEFADVARQYPEATFTVRHRGNYSHSNSTEFEFDLGMDRESDDPDAIHENPEAEKVLKVAARSFMDWIYKALERDYEHFTSDESIDDSLRSNEYTFREDGRRED